jgi:hypothetical protein
LPHRHLLIRRTLIDWRQSPEGYTRIGNDLRDRTLVFPVSGLPCGHMWSTQLVCRRPAPASTNRYANLHLGQGFVLRPDT